MHQRTPLIVTALIASWALLAPAPFAGATPVLSLTWDSCTGPVDKTPSGPGTYSLFASVTGIDQPHKAYEVWLAFGDANDAVPDAWRFDAAGCQGSALFRLDAVPAREIAAACPALSGGAETLPSTSIGFWPPDFGVPTTLMRAFIINAYPSGITVVDPGQRYFLARFAFDHMYSVTGPGTPGESCGGFEASICFRDVRGAYLTMDGLAVSFIGEGTQTATFNGGGCGAVPAHPATWGRIKNQYRN